MIPVIAIIGRPNVGKSTLFNRLTKSRDAIVADFPGLTRDRQYGDAKLRDWPVIVIDTGGLVDTDNPLEGPMADQTWRAVEEADAVLFMVDGRSGVTAADEMIAENLRNIGKKVILAVNKVDGIGDDVALSDFYSTGFGEPVPIAAAHNRGVRVLADILLEHVGLDPKASPEEEEEDLDRPISIAIVGRPNAGKSTLINRMLGEERVVVSDLAGTTRDSVSIPFERDDQNYILIDTAGVRRRGKVKQTVEKFSVIKTLQSIEASNVVVLLLDGSETITEQDLSLLSYVLEKGRALIVAVNKWDGLPPEQREKVKTDIARKLAFLNFTQPKFISALHGTGVGDLFPLVHRAYSSAMINMPTPRLTQILEAAVQQHAPPIVKGQRIKLRYAHQGGKNPPIVVVHGNQTDSIPDSYRRYLAGVFMKQFKLQGTPLRIEGRSGENPFEGRRNTLTPRQQRKKRRMIKHVKKR